MTSIDILYYSLSVGSLIFFGFAAYAFFNLSNTLKSLTSILTKVDALAKDADDFKNLIKSAVLNLINMFGSKKEVIKR